MAITVNFTYMIKDGINRLIAKGIRKMLITVFFLNSYSINSSVNVIYKIPTSEKM